MIRSRQDTRRGERTVDILVAGEANCWDTDDAIEQPERAATLPCRPADVERLDWIDRSASIWNESTCHASAYHHRVFGPSRSIA